MKWDKWGEFKDAVTMSGSVSLNEHANIFSYIVGNSTELYLEVIELNSNWSQSLKYFTAVNTPKTKQGNH